MSTLQPLQGHCGQLWEHRPHSRQGDQLRCVRDGARTRRTMITDRSKVKVQEEPVFLPSRPS